MFPKIDFLQRCDLLDDAEADVIGMKYQPIEGDDAVDLPGSGNNKIDGDVVSSIEKATAVNKRDGNIESYYQRKAERAALHNMQLRQVSDASKSSNALIVRALFVLVSGLLLAMLWMKVYSPQDVVKSQ